VTASNVLIAAPIFSDAFTGNLYTPAITGGSWEAGNPLANLADRRLHRIARSSGVTEAQTLFTADLGAARSVRCVALPKHTVSSAGTVRARGFLSVPVLDSLTVGDAAWTATGTPTRSAAAYTAPDGVPMDLIGDDDAGTNEGYRRAITYTGDGTKILSVRVKQGSSATSAVGAWDVVAGAWRHRINIAWSAGVPTVTTGAGSGSITTTLLGDGVYRITFTAPSVVAANTNEIYCYGSNFTIANTGTTYYADFLAWNATTDQQVHDSGYTAAIPAGLTTEDTTGLNCAWASVVASGTTAARYWRVNIRDTTNAAGYVDVARLVVAGGYQPTINMAPGASISLESDTTRTVSDGGAAIYDTRPLRRTARFSVINLPTSETFTQAWRVQKHLGASTQCFVMLAPNAPHAERIEQSFLATIRELSAIEYREAAFGNLSLAVVEEL
jgi:hypothetical protein